MAIAFTYDESLNKVVQTGGTSGTPATFASFVTADRAGTAELTPEDTPDACTTNMTLTYQIRPLASLALQISFILAGTSAGAGDTLDITGTDWDGQAQNESIDVSGGDATYNGAYKWRTITDIDCTGWADGTLQVTQPQWGVIWDNGNGQYQVNSIFDIGNGSTSTYFTSKNAEQVYGSDGSYFYIKAQATLQMGELTSSHSINGVCWNIQPENTYGWGFGFFGSFKMYGSYLITRGVTRNFPLNNSIIRESTIENRGVTRSGNLTLYGTIDMSGQIYCVNWSTIRFNVTPITYEDVHSHHCTDGVYFGVAGAEVTIKNVKVTDFSNRDYILLGAGTISLTTLNPFSSVQVPLIDQATAWISEKYTCNIHIADKDGANLASASIDCEYAHLVEGSDNKTYKCIQDHTAVDATHKPITGNDWASYWELYSDTENFKKPSWETGYDYKSGTEEFSTQTTDANGDITEQNIQYKKWVGTTEYEEARLHKFTITYAGLETLVLGSIMVDSPISWHLELQPMRARNYARSRVQGVQFQ